MVAREGGRNAISNWRRGFYAEIPPSIFPLVNLFLPFPCPVQVPSGRLTLPRLEPILPHSFSVSFSLWGQSTVSWGLTPRHWPLPFIGSFSSFDSDSLSPPSEIRGGGKEGTRGGGEETVKNKRKPSLRWKNEKEREKRLEPRNYGAWRDGVFLRYSIQSACLLRFQPFSVSMVATTLPKSRPPFDNDIKIYRNPASGFDVSWFLRSCPLCTILSMQTLITLY